MQNYKICIIGAGKMGRAISRGIIEKKVCAAAEIIITSRTENELESLKPLGTALSTDNLSALKGAETVIICVLPQQFDNLMRQIGCAFQPDQTLISIVTGVTLENIRKYVGDGPAIVRAMPNTAITIGHSMTCLATDAKDDKITISRAQKIFDAVGKTLVIEEDKMSAATALCACGIAFFLRAIRAASQGGIEIGFHSEEALLMAAQTALGAGALLTELGQHPEHEIDNVTSPQGCTIAGLNQMEHNGFSSALIKGIVTSAQKAGCLYQGCKKD